MNASKALTSALLTLLVVTSLVGAYYLERLKAVEKNTLASLVREAEHQLSYNSREYIETRNQIVSVAQLLSHSRNLYDYISIPTKQNRQLLESIWGSILVNQRFFTSIRYISTTGIESIRVDYSQETGIKSAVHNEQKPIRISHELLTFAQSISDKRTMLGPIHLSKVRDQDEFSASIPVVTAVTYAGVRIGYLLIEADLADIFSRLNYAPNDVMRPALLNKHGFYIDSKHRHWRFGELLVERAQYNLGQQYPMTWRKVETEGSGWLLENGSLNVFQPVTLSERMSFTLLISVTPEQIALRLEPEEGKLLREILLVLVTMLVIALPITFFILHVQRKGLESQLARAALDGMSAVLISDSTHKVVMVNHAFEKMTGLSRRMIRGKNALRSLISSQGMERVIEVLEIVSNTQQWEGEVEFNNEDGELVTALMRVQGVQKGGKISYYITSLMNITERKLLETKLRDLSERDSLTHLWNRRKFESEFQMQSQLCERYKESHHSCLAIIDIDHFKRVNDVYGHDEGDRVIKEVAQALSHGSRATDFVARIGGEEFALLMPHTEMSEAQLVLERLREYVEEHPNLNITVSAGVTDITGDIRATYKCADVALYDAKSSGRNRIACCLSSDGVA